MRSETIRLLMGAAFFGLAANFALGFVIYDQHGAHLLPSALVGSLVAAGVFFVGSKGQK